MLTNYKNEIHAELILISHSAHLRTSGCRKIMFLEVSGNLRSKILFESNHWCTHKMYIYKNMAGPRVNVQALAAIEGRIQTRII